ncbi:MAG: hypothetical protein QXF10_08890, partial [Ignisphaera sp.]
MSLSAEYIVKLFEEDARARKRLAELLVSEPDIRLAVVNAVLRDVATKSDLERVESSLRNEIRSTEKGLGEAVDGLRREFMEYRKEFMGHIENINKSIEN